MATIATLRAQLQADTVSFQTSMRQAAQVANQTLSQIQVQASAASDAIQTLGRSAAALVGFDALKEGVKSLLDAQVAAQQIHFSLLSATGSAGAADDAYAAVADTAQKLGLNLQDAALGFSRMSAAASANGVSMQDQLALFDGLAKSATVLHLTSDQTSSAILALSQMFGKGKIQAQELQLQLGQAIPGVVPRFQQAVLQMTQGTDLAGKSFEQLLEGGDLAVQRFIPALVQALNQTGAGADEASQGLNANLNRLSTAWFQAKQQLSSGLFSEAASAGVQLMAQNLGHVLTVAEALGGIAAGRVVGSGLTALAGAAVNSYQQQVAGPQMATQAELDYAGAQLEQAKAAEAASQASVQLNETWANSALAAQEAAQQSRALAFSELEAAQATLAHQETAATLSANIRAQQVATQEAAAAETRLAQATVIEDAAMVSAGRAAQQYVASKTALAEATAAVTAATEAQAAAQAELSATQAATSATGLLGRGLSTLGSALLGLVGGPVGAGITAFGALGYAIYSAYQYSQQYEQQTGKEVQSLKDLAEQAMAAAKAYGTLNAQRGLSQTIDLYSQDAASLDKTRQELADLIQQRDDLQKAMGTPGGGGMLAGQNLQDLTDRIQKLQQQLAPAQDAVNQLGDATDQRLIPSVNGLKSALDALQAGGGWESFFNALPTQADVDSYVKGIDTARAAVQKIQGELQANAKKLSDEAATDGMTNAQKQQYLLQQGIAQINAQHLTPDVAAGQIGELSTSAAAAIQAGAKKDAADAAKKAQQQALEAARQQKEANDNLTNSQDGQIASLMQQIAGNDKLTAAQKTLNDMLAGGDASFRKLSASEQADAIQRQQRIVDLTKESQAQQQATKDAAAYLVVQENLARIAQQYSRTREDSLSAIGEGDQQAQDQRDMTAIQRQYDDLQKQAGTSLRHGSISQDEYNKEVADYKGALDQELTLQQQFYAQRDAMQSQWQYGARAAYQNYENSANNVAAQTQQAFTDAFSGMENALVSFATTGKLSFTSFATSVLTDIARIELRAAESKVLSWVASELPSVFGGTAFSGGGGSFSSDTGALGAYNFDASAGSFNLAGGRANGGPTAAGSIYQVAENGPEVFKSGSNVYLLSNQNGYVSPMQNATNQVGGSGGISISQSFTFNADGSSNSSTQTQGQQQQAAKQAADALQAQMKQTVMRMTLPGGELYRLGVGVSA